MRLKKVHGFTLIELLVVIVLLGIVTSFAVLSMGTASVEREAEEEVKRLHALIKLVREESIIQAKEIAMEINKQEYSFLEYKNKKWVPLENKVFRSRSIVSKLEMTVETKTEENIFESKDSERLRLYFLSSGEQTPFEIRVSIKGMPRPYHRLVGEFNGKLKLESVNDYDS